MVAIGAAASHCRAVTGAADPSRSADEVAAWAASGAMAVTGRPGGPPVGPPTGLVGGVRQVWARFAAGAERLGGSPSALDPLALLGERAALAGLSPGGQVSCGGSSRLLPAVDGWIAVTLARDDDWALVPAWVDRDAHVGWEGLAEAVAASAAASLVERGALLGLPVAALPSSPSSAAAVTRTRVSGDDLVAAALPELVVVDLSSLWAGPLCGSLLRDAGATVIKVESTGRPDGARLGPAPFFDLLNAGKEAVALDLTDAAGVDALRALLLRADVVIEASRPRALEQLGIDATRVLAEGRVRAWVSITGHGRTGEGRNRAAFGDDAAVAGGLVGWSEGRPCFCADAVADPLAGLTAAATAVEALAAGGRWLIDVSMAGVAARHAGPTLPVDGSVTAAPPRARPVSGRGPRLGEHTDRVLASRRP